MENIHYKNENTAVNFEVYVTRIKESYNTLKYHGEVHNDSQKVQKLIRGIRSDTPAYLHTEVGIVQMDTALNNEFNLAVDRLSQYLSTRSPNVDFVRGNQGRGGRNFSSVPGGRRGGGRGGGKFGYERVGGDRFGYGKGEGGRGGRDGRGGCGSRSRGRGVGGNHNNYNNNRRKNQNHGVDTLDLTRNFTPEEVSDLIQDNLCDGICAEQRTK